MAAYPLSHTLAIIQAGDDPNVWSSRGIRRQWVYRGMSHGQRCNMQVELIARHPTLADTYSVRAVFAHNCLFAPDWARMADLEPISAPNAAHPLPAGFRPGFAGERGAE